MNNTFKMDPDAVDIRRIPVKTLFNGDVMPAIGLGTFGSDHYSNEDIAEAVRGALRVGYRLIDCAEVYGNESLIGDVLNEAMSEGLTREELFVISKVWNNHHDPEEVIAACKNSLKNLGLSYLDCYLVHWPFPNYHAPGCSGDARNPDSRPFELERFMQTWRAMELLHDLGLVKHIGVSNVTIPKLDGILGAARIQPSIIEMELHPCFQQGELFRYSLDHNMVVVGYSPLGSPARPERDRSPDDRTDIEMPMVQRIAQRHGVHPSAVCLKWANQRGQIPIPFTTSRSHYLSNLEAICSDPLTAEELEEMKSADRNNRLIKGQVFLWEGAVSWLDLWDADGTIPGWNGYDSDN